MVLSILRVSGSMQGPCSFHRAGATGVQKPIAIRIPGCAYGGRPTHKYSHPGTATPHTATQSTATAGLVYHCGRRFVCPTCMGNGRIASFLWLERSLLSLWEHSYIQRQCAMASPRHDQRMGGVIPFAFRKACHWSRNLQYELGPSNVQPDAVANRQGGRLRPSV